jgi:hypothetical protein
VFDNVTARHRVAGGVLRRVVYAAERTPLREYGLSRFLVVRKGH